MNKKIIAFLSFAFIALTSTAWVVKDTLRPVQVFTGSNTTPTINAASDGTVTLGPTGFVGTHGVNGTIPAASIKGSVTGAIVASGIVGEKISATLANVGAAASTVYKTFGTVTVGPGVFVCYASLKMGAAGTTWTNYSLGISETADIEPTGYVVLDLSTVNASHFVGASPYYVRSSAGGKQVFLNAQVTYTGTAPTSNGSESNFYCVRAG